MAKAVKTALILTIISVMIISVALFVRLVPLGIVAGMGVLYAIIIYKVNYNKGRCE